VWTLQHLAAGSDLTSVNSSSKKQTNTVAQYSWVMHHVLPIFYPAPVSKHA
jgi:hypothetical protein